MASAVTPAGRLLARNSVLNLVGLGAPMVVALAAVPMLVSGLGTERFGVFALAWMVLSYLGEMGFGSTSTRFTADAVGAGAADRVPAIAWTTTILQVGLGAVQGAALAVATPWLVESAFRIPPSLWGEARDCLYLLAVALPILGASKSFRGVLEGYHRFDLVTAVRLPATAANYVFPVLGVLAGWSLSAVFALLVGSRLIPLVAYGVLAVRLLPSASWRPRFAREAWRSILGFGGWVMVSSMVSPLLVSLDRFLVGALLSMSAVAYYTAPYEVVSRVLMIPMSVVGALYPAFSQLGGAGDRGRGGVLAARSVKALVLVTTPITLVLLGMAPDALRLWLGAEFARESAAALQLLAVGVLISGAAHVPYALLQASGRPDLPARFHILELPVHAGLAWLLVSRWGIPGAAVAWTLRVGLDAVLLFTAAHRLGLLRLKDLAAERVVQVFVVSGLVGVGMVAAGRALPAVGARVGMVAALLALTMLVLWRYAMDGSERSRFRTLLRPTGSA